MAYINIADWTPDQVTDWLKGLDDSLYKYTRSFTNNEVNGTKLLNIRPYELEQLGMYSIGHQEIVLEAVENLRNFHYNLKQENLQFMALHVATAARSLHRKLAKNPEIKKIETQTLNDITRTLATIKPLIGWLERAPFRKAPFNEICKNMLRIGLELATVAHRDRFVENPIEQINHTAEKLERLGNYIIQDISDPMLLQPASLNLVTFKKKEADVGFNIDSSYQGIHRIIDIKTNSPVHNSGKIEDGDEIVQINYQTVVGWQATAVIQQLRESVPDVLLTLKKRPKHTKIYGQIYDQPYRLPSKKRVMATRWGEKAPSPRPGFLTVPDKNVFHMPVPLKSKEKVETEVCSDSDSSCSDILTPTDTKTSEKEIRLYYRKPRTMLQRRNTICGDEFLHMKNISGTPFWHERKVAADPASPSLRDKSVSFGFGLEMTSRPTTCMGKFGAGSNAFTNERKGLKQLSEVLNENDQDAIVDDNSKPGVCKVVRFDANMKVEDYQVNEKYSCNVQNTILETFEPILFADEEEEDALDSLHNTPNEKTAEMVDVLEKALSTTNANANANTSLTEAVNLPVVARRGRLDKSHSTPAYDNSAEEECDTPPAIEPRKEFLLVSPPIPPPKPRKKDMPPLVVPPPPPKPLSLKANASASALQANPTSTPAPYLTQSSLVSTSSFSAADKKAVPPLPMETISDAPLEINELHTPTKAKTLTLKKKHNLIAKRRNVNLKSLGTGEIQGHLYRRKKDKRGVTFWARLYFVMLDTILYGFRTKDANKASCVIFLPGFTVSLAKEVYSKSHAFKVYHSAKTFYFAAESQDALNQWVDFIKQATLQSTNYSGQSQDHHHQAPEIKAKDLFSENESSEEENESTIASNLCTPSPQTNKDIASLLSSGSKGSSSNASTPVTTKADRNYFGSLKKLTKSGFISKSSTPSDKKSSDIPVPTEQYRSYRKVPGGSSGIQIGTNTPGFHDPNQPLHQPTIQTTQSSFPMSSQPSLPSPSNTSDTNSLLNRNTSLSYSSNSLASNSESNSTLCLGPPSSPAPVPTSLASASASASSSTIRSNSTLSSNDDSPSKSNKKLPYNFLHASNPNLVEFDFQTSKTLDYSLPKINSSNTWEVHHNIQGFVTLKDLMLKKQQEEAQEMYNNRVDHGIERKRDLNERKAGHKRNDSQHTNTNTFDEYQHQSSSNNNNNFYNGKIPKTQLRSLPKTPDDEISFKPDDEDIRRTRTKEGLKLRDFGYELISGDEPISSSASQSQTSNSSTNVSASRQGSNASSHSHHSQHNWTSAMKTRQFLKSQLNAHKQKKHSSNSCSSTSSADFTNATTTNNNNINNNNNNLNNSDKQRSSSFKKKKLSSDRLFHFHKSSSSSSSAAAAASSSANTNSGTMTLPSKKTQQTLKDQNNSLTISSNSGIKKSNTYNNDLKDKASAKYDVQRKNSAPMQFFPKLSFASHSSNTNNNASTGAASTSSSSSSSNAKPLKERKLLGSPHLHRAIFGMNNHHHHQQQQPSTPQHQYQSHHQSNTSIQSSSTTTSGSPAYSGRGDYDQEIFAQVILPTNNSSSSARYRQQLSSTSSNNNSTENPSPPVSVPISVSVPTITLSEKSSTPSSTVATPEYPNMECPPVFEPEIYSLTDSNASLSLLLRRNNSTASTTGNNQINSSSSNPNSNANANSNHSTAGAEMENH